MIVCILQNQLLQFNGDGCDMNCCTHLSELISGEINYYYYRYVLLFYDSIHVHLTILCNPLIYMYLYILSIYFNFTIYFFVTRQYSPLDTDLKRIKFIQFNLNSIWLFVWNGSVSHEHQNYRTKFQMFLLSNSLFFAYFQHLIVVKVSFMVQFKVIGANRSIVRFKQWKQRKVNNKWKYKTFHLYKNYMCDSNSTVGYAISGPTAHFYEKCFTGSDLHTFPN